MAKRRCVYFLTLGDLVDDEAISDTVLRRFQKLVKRSYEESGARYAPLRLGNDAIAELWHVNEEAARKSLAEMRELELIETEQVGRYARRIVLLAVYREDGMDSAGETGARVSRHNAAPLKSAVRQVALAPATGLPAQPKPASTARSNGGSEGGNHVPTLAESPNSVVVAVGTDISVQEKSVPTTATTSSTRTREDRRRIRDALWDLGIESDEAQAKILGDEPDVVRGKAVDYAHVTPEYVEDWMAYHVEIGAKAKLHAGYYRQQIREGRVSTRTMSPRERADYRAFNDRERAKDEAA